MQATWLNQRGKDTAGMRRNTGALLLVCLLAVTVAQAQSEPSAELRILPLLREQMVAANAHDTDRFLTSFFHDASLIFVINGEVIRGFDNLHERQLKWWNYGKSDATYTEQTPPDFVSLNSKTVLVTQQLASRRTMPDGKPSEGKFVVTTIWRRLPAGWRVIYCHESRAQ
jgi:ketosteroid isomerase-like protein